MTVLLVDTNVLIDLVTEDSQWADWSQRQLEKLALQARLIVNPIVHAELSIGFRTVEEVDRILDSTGIELEGIPRLALFLAGKAFQTYRARGGSKSGVLPDFFMGGHAVAERIGLLTRDTRRYRGYFPTIELITPGDA